MIHIEGLTVAFGRTLALDDLTLELSPGVTGLYGQNGSGKSTLLRVLAGLLRPTAGSVTVDGAPLSLRNEEWRRQVGYAGHSGGLYGDLTLAENLDLFRKLYGVSTARVREVIDGVGMGSRAGTRVNELSAGLRRRAAVARAMLHEPRLLLLDEPYANLDDEAAEQVSDLVRRWRAPGRAAVIATHGAKRVKGWADAGLVLQRGRQSSYRVAAEL